MRSNQHTTSWSAAASADVPESGLQSADKFPLVAAVPAADKDQQVLIKAVTATAVPGTPPELQVQDLQQQQQSVSSYGQGALSQTKGLVETQDLQQQQQAICSCRQGLLSQKKGLFEKQELLTDHEAAAEVRRHSSCEEQVEQPAEGQSAESIRWSLLSAETAGWSSPCAVCMTDCDACWAEVCCGVALIVGVLLHVVLYIPVSL